MPEQGPAPPPAIDIRDLVLIGGGHAHVHLLRSSGLEPLRSTLRDAAVRITLVTRDARTPYSGMLPGYVAGHYREEEIYIDLVSLCDRGGVRFVHDSAIGVEYFPESGGGGNGDGDGDGNGDGRGLGVVRCSSGSTVRFDALGIDVGSSPGGFFSPDDGGSDDDGGVGRPPPSVTPVKPISSFSSRFASLTSRLRDTASSRSPDRPFVLAVCGGGAGGVELALSARHALRRVLSDGGGCADALRVVLVTKGAEILGGHNDGVRRIFERVLRERRVEVRCGAEAVGAEAVDGDGGGGGDDGGGMWELTLSSDSAPQAPVRFHECLWCTTARAPPFLSRSTPFPTTPDGGFVLVRDTYEVADHPGVFASGDCCHMSDHPRPKAGVFAVRAGPVITENAVNYVLGRPLRRHRPQAQFLGLISTGDRYAVASRGRWALEGGYLWKLKDRIDRRWMRDYQELPREGSR